MLPRITNRLTCSLTMIMTTVFALALSSGIGVAQDSRAAYDLTRPSVTPQPGEVFQEVGFDQRLGEKVPLDLPLVDESGNAVVLGDYLGEKPAILALIYYRCPMLCGQTVNSLVRSLRALTPTAGDTFEVITVSFDPKDTPDRAALKKKGVVEAYDRARGDRGLHFLTGDPVNVARLEEAIGFRARYNPSTDEFAHAAGIVILAPDGTITRYFFGIDYPPKELGLSLDEAGAGQVSSPVGRLLMLCYDYDPHSGKYTLAVVRILQIAGTATALLLGGSIVTMLLRDRRRRLAEPPPNVSPMP